ncbi:MAG: T9SS type B sorting domain-containing protein [Bacteroidia bacterium]
MLFLQENFQGGICLDGHDYQALTYFNEDTINFQNAVPTGATIRKALLLSRRITEFNPNPGFKDTPTRVKFNGISLVFDSSDIVTNVFSCNYNSNAAKNWMLAKDVTSLTFNSGNKLITPYISNIPDFNCYAVGFILVILYDDTTMPTTNAVIFLNDRTYSIFMTYDLSGLNRIDNSKDVGLSVWATNVNIADYFKVGLVSSQGTYTLGSLYENGGPTYDHLVPGSFYYQNNTLSGLEDDSPDGFIDSTDALANIKNYIANSTTNFSVNVDLGDVNSGCYDVTDGFILAYSSPCPPTPNIPIQNFKICITGSVSLTPASSGITYSWYPSYGLNDTTIANPIASPTVSTSYVVTITDSIGCHHTEQFKVLVKKSLPKIDSVDIVNAVCGQTSGTCTVLTNATSLNPYLYNDGSGNQSSNVLNNLIPGNYTVTVTDNIGCTNSTTFSIENIYPTVSFSFSPTEICVNSTVQFTSINSSGVNNANWFYNNTQFSSNVYSAFQTFADTGAYSITLIGWHNYPQCGDTVTKTIYVKECPPDSFVVIPPNIFTPNEDGINETWLPIIYNYGFTVNDYSIIVFDRWGLKIFETTSINEGWDGHTISGLECTNGTYYYVLKYKATNTKGVAKKDTKKGFVELVR